MATDSTSASTPSLPHPLPHPLPPTPASSPVRLPRALLWFVAGLAAVLAVALAALAWSGIPATAAGMAAKGVCSAAFVAGRAWPTLLADDVLPASAVLKAIRVTVNDKDKQVSATFAGLFDRTASWLPSRGCVLDLGGTVARPDTGRPANWEGGFSAGRAKGTPQAATPQAAAAPRPWPDGNGPLPLDQWPPGVNAVALQSVIAQAMAGAGDPAAANPRGVAVVVKGKLIALQTAPGFAPDTLLHGWSMAKTVTGMLLYKMAADSGLPLNTPVVNAFLIGREPPWVAAWRNDARRGIKVSDLLYMRDGLANAEDYQPGGAVPRMLWGERDAAAYAAAAVSEAPPGQRWRYLSQTANLLTAVARGRAANDREYWDYPQRALFNPIGAYSAVMETDTAGNWVGSSYVWASVGDWARLGQLMLNDGQWGERQVLPAGWLKRAATAATPGTEGRGYGAMTWLYGQPQAGACKGRGIPDDTLAMIGLWGQIVAMVPSREAVIVRLGWTFDKTKFDGCALVANILKTLPK